MDMTTRRSRKRTPAMAAIALTLASGCVLSSEASSGFEQGLEAYQQSNGLEAGEFWQPCAQHGDPRCQYGLGVLFDDGAPDWPHDTAKALIWLRRAGLQGHLNAQIRLGFIFAVGRKGVSQNIEEAYIWFSLAASQGSPAAVEHRRRIMSLMTEQELARAETKRSERSIQYHQQQ